MQLPDDLAIILEGFSNIKDGGNLDDHICIAQLVLCAYDGPIPADQLGKVETLLGVLWCATPPTGITSDGDIFLVALENMLRRNYERHFMAKGWTPPIADDDRITLGPNAPQGTNRPARKRSKQRRPAA